VPAPEIIHRLIEQFRRNRATYTSQKYNETLLRQEFLNPFFKALGWDIDNEKGFALQYREVIHEDRVDVDGSTKAPDYAFRIGGVRKFFVEAKKPAEDIEGDANLAYQLRRYAWNAHLPVSILTDFEEFAVYDCRNKPNPGDSPATSRIMLLRYADYVERWDEIAAIFSPEAILMGAFDRYAEDNTGKRGTIKVDDAFLSDIEEWRTLLARNIALRNPQVADERQLNFAVQMIIDRIIFLRISEDRKIEPENQLREISEQEGIYPALVSLFERADLRYNSGLFHFKKEKGRTDSVDTLTPALDIDDKVLKGIIKDLYFPSPYIFNEIPVEILGQVYEQFLGKVIRLTAGHRAKVEEKPEVRKAGGVYYTPKYIVDYIVEHTVGKLLEGKTPREAARLKIVDPACGSGSFLLGAFQYLLNWHEGWYLDHDPAQWAQAADAALSPGEDGGWRISTAEKKRILLNNIFGVDIDAQAVEVTKLSLLLKVLEGETGQLSLGFERVLPDLGANIQCGNSLIGPDYYEGKQLGLFNEEEMYRINAFDWERAFPEVFAQGGFDAVIGNPPYIRIQAMKEWAPVEVEHYKERYISASKGNYDIYVVFVEKGLSLLNKKGRLGYILPHKFFTAQFGKPIRQLLTQGKNVEQIVHFGSQQVFSNATTYTCLLFLNNSPQEEVDFVSINDLSLPNVVFDAITNDGSNEISFEKFIVPSLPPSDLEWVIISDKSQRVMEKLSAQPYTLGDITKKIFVGLQTSADKIYVLKVVSENNNNIICYSNSLDKNVEIEKGLVKPFLMGKEVHRYQPLCPENVVIFPYLIDEKTPRLMSQAYIKENFPKGWDYLLENRTALSERERGRMFGKEFYAYIYPKNLTEFNKKKIVTPEIAFGCQLTLDVEGIYYHTTKVYGFDFKDSVKEDEKYFLGVLNSKLLWFFISQTGYVLRGGYYVFKTKYLEPFPLHMINFSDHNEIKQYDHIVSLVDQMLDLNNVLKNAKTPNEKTQLQRQIDATDAEIDRLVYELYGLTEDEIRIVEESVK
jgi:hypothetical protein